MGNRKATFRWSKEAEAALQRWKECMEILPTFTVPDHSEALFLHLATPSGEVSAVLLVKRRGIYIPIYSANRTLQEIELSYTKAEILILTLALELGEYSIEYRKEDLAEGQAPTNVLSKLNQTSTSTKKELHRTRRTNKILSGGSKTARITKDQSSTKSLRQGEDKDAPNLFVPEEPEPPARQDMKVSGSPASRESIPLTE
ncbi:reverse transcriptase domain-containing protein [Artemisia annua]|uniref:Reverse transcriptase domain-containing protein n=1 Tax=Artemisia annua TaxID=35608 RepID=A0A2U1N2T3_ARTAN|nr:reverse transcriptase domain-containing protein [Artemisia annua]